MAGMRADVNLNVNTTQAKRSVERAAAEINRVINGIGGKQVSFNVNSRSFTQPLGRINASANEFTKSLEASNARVIAFGASVGIINGISEAFKGLVVETVRFEKTLTDINVVLNASAQSLERFGQGLFDVAKNTAQSFNVSAEAALEFSRQGLTMEEVLTRTNDALTLTRLTGLKATEAVSGLTAAVNAFGGAGLTTTDIIDKLAAVDVKFAVSSADLISALERTGAVAIDAGVEINSLIGLVAALQQTTARGGAVIGNGLKTIFTRIQRPESIRQLEEMGLAVRDLSGAILPADQLMLGMAKSFDKLTQSQQSNIVQFSAGIFQANVFRAALRDLSKEQSLQSQAAKIAANATGDAAKKNEILNKTMSAMASQTVTSLQELAETIGKLTLTPEIGGLLSFLQDGIEGFQNMLGGGEERGSDFAKGLVRGVGNVLTGPAAVAFGAMFIKLFFNISKFAAGSFKDVLGIVSEKDKIKQMEESITKALSENFKIQEGLNNLEGDRKAQEQFILGIIEKQNQAMAAQAKLAASLARPLIQAGINPDFTKKSGKTGSSGVIPESAREEIQGAAKGGYRAGKVDSMNVPGMGEVVYNKAEKVKRFPGMKQPAIMPPQQSRAGKNYKDAFVGQHGFNPYASGGLVPNFARMQGNKLVLDKSLTKLSANPGSARTTDEIRKSYIDLVANGQPVNVEATMPQLLNNSGRGHSEKVKDVLKFLHQEAGVAAVSRQFDLKKLPFRGQKSDAAAEAAVLKKEGKGFFSTGGRSGDPTFPVDLAGLGMRPIEVKSGQWKLPNVLMKSMRLYSDDGLMEFAKNFGASEELISGARGEKFKKGSKMLMKKKLLAKDSTDEEKHQSLLDYRLSAGFVPNFTGGLTMAAKSLAAEFNPKKVSKTKMRYTSLANIVEKSAKAKLGDDNDKSISTIAAEMGIAESTISNSKNPETPSGGAALDALGPRYDQYVKNLNSISKGKLAFHLQRGRDFEGQLLSVFGLSRRTNKTAPMDYNQREFEGQDAAIKKKIQMLKATKHGDAYAGPEGHAVDHFMAKAIREQKTKITGFLEGKKKVQRVINTGNFADIIGTTGGKTDDVVNGQALISDIAGHSKIFFKEALEGAGYKPTKPVDEFIRKHQDLKNKSLRYKYTKDFVDINKVQQMSGGPASLGFVPNYAVNLSNGYHDKRSIGKAISSVYKSKTGKQMGRKDVDFSIERYISAIKDKQADDGKSFVSNYPGGNFSVGGQKFNFNEISMALLKHGQFMEGQNKGLVPNFADLYKPYINKGGKAIGMENYFYSSNNQEDALNYIKSNKNLNRKTGSSELRKFSFPPRVWKMLTSNNPQDIEPQMNVLPIGTRTPIGKGDPYRDTSLGKGMSEREDFSAIALKNAYGIRPPFFEKTDSWRNGATYTTLMTNSSQFREMYNLNRLDGKNVIPNFAANWKRFKKFDKDGYIKKIKKNKSNNEKAQIDAYVKAAGGAQKFQRLNEKFGLDKVDDIFQILGFAKGYVPNFANPLGDAVSREKAAGVPSSKIRIEKSSELKSPQNPMGLAVTNTRDEPMGIQQGIRRAKNMGIDPKKHGASSGLVPNFVGQRKGSFGDFNSKKFSHEGDAGSASAIKKEKTARDESTKSIKENAEAIDKSTDSSNQDSMQSMMNLQRLFLFQSGLSVANGFLEQFAKEGGKTAKTFAELGMAATSITGAYIQQKTVVNELMESFDMSKEDGIGMLDSLKGVATEEGRSNIKGSLTGSFKKGKDAFMGTKGFGKKLGLLKKGIGAVTKGFLRFTPLIGQLYTGFTIADEALKNFTGIFKDLPFIGGFFSELEDGEGIMDLFNNSADRAAKKLEKLSESAEKTNAALEASQSLEKTEKEIRELSMKGQSKSVAEDLKLLELKKAELKQMSQLSKQLKGVNAANGESAQIIDLVNKVKSEEFNGTEKLTKALQALSVERERQLHVQSLKAAFEESMVDVKKTRLDPKSPGRIIMSKEQGLEIATLANSMARFIQTLEPERKNKIKGQLQVADKKNDIGEVLLLRSLDKTLGDVPEGKLANQTLSILDKLEKEDKIEIAKLAASKNLDKEIEKTIAAQKNNRKQIELRGKINSQMNNMQRKEQSFLREILSEQGGISAATKIQEDSLDKLNKIQEDYNNKADSINNKLIDQAQDELNKRFKDDQASINKQLSKKTFKAGGDFELTGADAKILNELNASLKNEEDVSKKRLMIAEADLTARQRLALTFAANGEIEGSLVAKELEKFKKMLKDKDDALMLNDISLKSQKESVEQETIKAKIGKRTVDGARILQRILESGIPHSETAIAAMEGNAANLKVESNFRKDSLQKILKSSALIDEANETQRQKNITDTEAAKKSLEQLNYQVRNFQTFKQLREFNFKKEVATQELSSKELKERLEVFSKTKDYKDLIENKLKDEIAQAGLAERDAQLKNNFYNTEKNRIDLVTRQTNAEILNLNTTNLINQEKIKQLAEQGKITQLVAGQIAQSKISATGNLQVAREKFQQTGSPEDAKALAEAMTALNLEFQNGSRAADALRERMAEMSVNAANLGADLVNIGFDNARSGLKDLFKSIGSGAKSASEAWSDFGLGLAESLLDRIMEHNIDKIMSNLSFAFTGQDLVKDSNILLKESNVMLKGSNEALRGSNQTLSSSNQALNGSNQALNVSNQALNVSNQSLLNSNTTLVTAINANTLALNASNTICDVPVQQFAKGGFVKGPGGIDKVPAMLTAGEYVVPKEEAQKFNNGTGQKGVQQKSRVRQGAEGITQMVAMNEVAKFVAKSMEDEDTSSPPTFDKNKFKNLDLRSDVNISRGDPRLSSRFLARDPVMQDYKDFLLEKAAYEAQKTNEKFKKKQNTIASIVQMVGSTAASGLVAVATDYASKAIQWGKEKVVNTAMGHTGLGKHSEAFKSARADGMNVNYSDVKDSIQTGKPLKLNGKDYSLMPQPNGSEKWEQMNFSDQPNTQPKSHRDIMAGQKFGIDTSNTDLLGSITGMRRKARRLQSGGSVPAMLTAGEGFIPSGLANRIGYDNLDRMNKTGEMPIIQGPGGIDNVGPVGLTEGDFIIKKSSTDKLLRENPAMMKFALQNPDGFKRGESGYYDGGMVSNSPVRSAPSVPAKGSGPVNRLSASDPAEMLNQTSFQGSPATKDNDTTQKRATTNNINVNVTIDQSGQEKVSTDGSSGSYEKEQELSMKIKSAVLEVIRDEKRIGGELS